MSANFWSDLGQVYCQQRFDIDSKAPRVFPIVESHFDFCVKNTFEHFLECFEYLPPMIEEIDISLKSI